MKSLRARRFGWMMGLWGAAALLLAACAPDPTELLISPQLGEQMAALEAGNAIVMAEPTEAPKLSDLAPEAVTAGLPDDVAAALAAADPASGEQVALARGCVGCHALDPAATMTGPTWYHIGDTAKARRSISITVLSIRTHSWCRITPATSCRPTTANSSARRNWLNSSPICYSNMRLGAANSPWHRTVYQQLLGEILPTIDLSADTIIVL